MPLTRPTANRWKATAALCSLLLVTGCMPFRPDEPAPEETASAPAEAIADAPQALTDYYAQTIVWEPCEQSYSCATLEVPMDYENPDGKVLEIDAIRMAATGIDPIGSLLINPGGPGASGYDAVLNNAAGITTERLRGSYDLIGFDPRGVKRSSPVECLSDEERDEFRATVYDLETEEGLANARAGAAEYASQCAENTGGKLEHVDTESAARDMDIIRAVAGDKKLNYLGFSYGTTLGATYADIFPDKVGRMVLDGGIDPTLPSSEVVLGQARGFERTLHAYARSCLQQSDCPLTGPPDKAVDQIGDLIESVEQSPMTADSGRTVTVGLFVSGLILPLYSDRTWPALTAALQSAFNGDPTEMLNLADLGANRQPDGTYTANTSAAFTAINCLDYPMNLELDEMRAQAETLDAASPTLGRFLGYGALTCNAWPYDAEDAPEAVNASGAAPILVVGTTGDPATPYDWSASLAEQLDSGMLLTWEGEGHTAYGRANDCIAAAVDDYLIEGTAPVNGTRC